MVMVNSKNRKMRKNILVGLTNGLRFWVEIRPLQIQEMGPRTTPSSNSALFVIYIITENR